MQIYYDEHGRYVGGNNTGHFPDGAVGFTHKKPSSEGMIFDVDADCWVVGGSAENIEDIINGEGSEELGESEPLNSGKAKTGADSADIGTESLAGDE